MKKTRIDNTFFDLLAVSLSFCLNIFRSITTFFTLKQSKKNRFFDILDFLFRKWPQYFWRKPTLYKLMNFVGDFLYYIFPDKKIHNNSQTDEKK